MSHEAWCADLMPQPQQSQTQSGQAGMSEAKWTPDAVVFLSEQSMLPEGLGEAHLLGLAISTSFAMSPRAKLQTEQCYK